MNVTAFLLVALATPVFGQLKWENPEQTLNAKPLDKFTFARFRFTNIGTVPVKITDVRVYDCVVAKDGVRSRGIRRD